MGQISRTVGKAVKIPRNKKYREVFKLYFKNDLIVAVSRQEDTMPIREKELVASGFTPADKAINNVPNARYLWRECRVILRKHKVLHTRLVPNELKPKKNIQAYKLDKDFDLDPLIEDLTRMECQPDAVEWFKVVAAAAGRLPTTQTRMEQYMQPKRPRLEAHMDPL
jgi:hypothetical protein